MKNLIQIALFAVVALLPFASLKADPPGTATQTQNPVVQPVYYPGSYVNPDYQTDPGETEANSIYKANQHPGI